jgi:hypothetical protein
MGSEVRLHDGGRSPSRDNRLPTAVEQLSSQGASHLDGIPPSPELFLLNPVVIIALGDTVSILIDGYQFPIVSDHPVQLHCL